MPYFAFIWCLETLLAGRISWFKTGHNNIVTTNYREIMVRSGNIGVLTSPHCFLYNSLLLNIRFKKNLQWTWSTIKISYNYTITKLRPQDILGVDRWVKHLRIIYSMLVDRVIRHSLIQCLTLQFFIPVFMS